MPGEVAEWSIAAVLKTVELRGSGGSNPSLSARPRSKKVSRNRYLLFFIPCRKLACRRGVKNKGSGLPLFAQWACKGPCGEQKGKALSGATIGSAVANSSLSAIKFTSFIPCRKLACRQRCEKQREWLATFCAVGLQGPLRRAEGKGVKRSDHRERSSQFLSLRHKIHKFYTLSQACLQTRCEKQRERLAAFCAVGLQGPLRRAEGKGVKRSDHRERSSQFLPLR